MKKTLLTILCTVLVCSCVMGVTLAFLIDSTETITNTFTVGDINITLDESDDLDLKMIPGSTIDKDPTVTVEAGSEACWLFVKIEKSENFGDFMEYALAEGWTLLEDGVYYRKVAMNEDADQTFAVLAGGTDAKGSVTVKDNVTKDMADALTETTYPTLSFTAYAVQQENVDDAATAWGIANPNPSN